MKNKYWEDFKKSGKVEDYLKYRKGSKKEENQ